MPVNGVAVASVGAGVLFVYSGVKGWSVLSTLQDVVAGKAPKQSEINVLTSDSGGATGPSSNTGNALADEALKYKGHAYLFGGAPGPGAINPWDCSSMDNYCATAVGLPIPGGKYNVNTHGPPTGIWLLWPGLKRVPVSEAQAGDIVIFAGHMGICINNKQMISALNPKDGTQVTNIFSGVLKCGRYE
jgi:peptidoglycan DL-endopeptidase CwlO